MATYIYEFIEAAKAQLPEAFSAKETFPWPDHANNVPVPISSSALHREAGEPGRVINDRTAGPDAPPLPPDFPLPRSLGEDFAAPADLAELREEIGQSGTETLAIYVSFHDPLPDGSWGVFLYGEPMWRLREDIRRRLLSGAQDRHSLDVADWLAADLVKPHEYYHFRADLYALHQELILRRPLYLPYSNHVYPQVWLTSDCYEESLANCSLCDHAARSRARRFVPARQYWHQYAVDFCDKQPPGYRDYGRPRELMKRGLGGQINLGQSQMLPVPQSEWVGLHPYDVRRDCPVYLIPRTPSSRSGLKITVKCAGDNWRFHLYDPDPFPSAPHGHNLSTGEKLNPYTGERFGPRGRNHTGMLSPNELRRVQADIVRKWPHISFS